MKPNLLNLLLGLIVLVAINGCADPCAYQNPDGSARPGCEDVASATDTPSDDPATTECSDSADNDGDGLTDFPWDPGCYSASDDDETD
ncbi:MAG: hypothetical protein Q8P90_00855, partial [bacterium]|nr:hypothetical protein [bacterium]